MSHVTCPKCGSNAHTSGFGLAAGPMGAYTFCDGCGVMLEFFPDLDDLSDDAAVRIKKSIEEWRTEVWGGRE